MRSSEFDSSIQVFRLSSENILLALLESNNMLLGSKMKHSALLVGHVRIHYWFAIGYATLVTLLETMRHLS